MNKPLKATVLASSLIISLITTSSTVSASTITLVKGDTVWGLAQKHNTTVATIARENHLSNPNKVYAGHKLVVPDNKAKPKDKAVLTSNRQPTTLNQNYDYIVQNGDTLSSLSEQLGISVQNLRNYNGLTDVNDLSIGQTIHTRPQSMHDTTVAPQSAVSSTVTASATANQTSTDQQRSTSMNPGSTQQSTNADASTQSASAASQTVSSDSDNLNNTSAQAAPSQNQMVQQQTPTTTNSQATSLTPSAQTNNNVQASNAASEPAADNVAPIQQSVIAHQSLEDAGIAGYWNGVDGYPAYQCTGFVAGILRASGVPSAKYAYLGNGADWGASARQRGILVDNQPTAGSVAYFAYNHVAYVTGVNGNGTVNIIEGNFSGMSFHARTISTTEAAGYIHF
ncbi:MAG TPA: hypothetical protein DCW31_06810 [Lactobacillus sp.]|nr:hypothetical protein [Lactobacillus sp.]